MRSKLFEEIYDPYDDDLGYGPDGLGVYDGEMTDFSGEMDERDELIPDEDHAKVGLKPVSRKNDDGTMSGFDKFEDEDGWTHYRNRRDMGFVDGGSAAYDDGSLMGQDMWDEPLEKDPEADDIEMQNFYQPRRAYASSQLDNEPYRNLGYIDKDNPIEEVDYDPFEEGKKQFFNKVLNESSTKVMVKFSADDDYSEPWTLDDIKRAIPEGLIYCERDEGQSMWCCEGGDDIAERLFNYLKNGCSVAVRQYYDENRDPCSEDDYDDYDVVLHLFPEDYEY